MNNALKIGYYALREPPFRRHGAGVPEGEPPRQQGDFPGESRYAVAEIPFFFRIDSFP